MWKHKRKQLNEIMVIGTLYDLRPRVHSQDGGECIRIMLPNIIEEIYVNLGKANIGRTATETTTTTKTTTASVSDVSMRQNSGDESSDWMLQWICCGSCHGAFALKSIRCKNREKKNLHQLSWKAYVHVKCTPFLVYLFLFCSFTI